MQMPMATAVALSVYSETGDAERAMAVFRHLNTKWEDFA